MQCNIDAKGKAIRLMIGLASLAAAGLLAVLILTGLVPGGWLWLAVVVAAASGAFAVFEARAGWCAAKAMGMRMPF